MEKRAWIRITIIITDQRLEVIHKTTSNPHENNKQNKQKKKKEWKKESEGGAGD